MNRDVSINIKSVQIAPHSHEEERDTTELFTCGRLISKGNRIGDYTLSYSESEVTGFAGNKISLAVTEDNMVVMRRSGDCPSNLIIEKGKKHHCHYGTPYGDFMVGIYADDVQCNLNENGGGLYMKYTVDINSALMSKNEMYIDFTLLDSKEGKDDNQDEQSMNFTDLTEEKSE
ncbi:MAG: DUF1934 domain-containing protein [Oscillospiraceae bacterium]|nr:DUF1934 domain-containing protein [Oscillospiraceae bacterium]